MSSLPLFEKVPLQTLPLSKKLRPYQDRTIIRVRALVLMGKQRILCVGPTAVGKTVIFSNIIRSATLPVLVVAHRKELIDQCVEQLAQQGITNVGVIRGNDARFNPYASIQVGSVATLARRDRPFLGQKIILIADEAHRCGADAWRDLIFAYDNPILLGFTATPVRLDGRPLGGDLFEELVQIATYDELLKNPDWLVAPDVYGPPIDVSMVPKSGSDFDEDVLATVMHTDRLEGDIVEHWLRRAHLHPVFNDKGMRMPKQFTEGERRRTVVFAVNVAHSQSIAARFEKVGVRVVHLDANTPESQREAAFRDLTSGEIEVVCNCQIAVEGVDVPPIKCVVAARPTHSLTVWRQQTGREMRPWNNVTPLLLDHAGNFDRLGCPFEDLAWSLTGRPKRFSGRPPMKLCHACFAYVASSALLCPYCGGEFTTSEQGMPQESKEVLEERQTGPEALKWAFFWRQVVTAKARGFKPGYASAMFKEHYGTWPPRHWSEKIKADFSTDPTWQHALDTRLKRKAAREEQELREAQAMAEAEKREEPSEEERSEEESALERTIEAIDAPFADQDQPACWACGGSGWDGTECITCNGTGVAPPQNDGESPFADWLEEQGIKTVH